MLYVFVLFIYFYIAFVIAHIQIKGKYTKLFSYNS